MLGINRILNLISTVLLSLLLILLVSATILTYSTSSLISDRATIKKLIKSEEVKRDFIVYLQAEIETQTEGSLSLIIDEDEVNSLINSSSNEEKFEEILDSLIDNTYDWLEGKSDTPSIVFNSDEQENDQTLLEQEIRGKLGPLEDFINYDQIDQASSQFRLYEINPDHVNKVPEMYNNFLTLHTKLLFISLFVALILILSTHSLRKGGFLIGLILIASGAVIIFTPQYIDTVSEEGVTATQYLNELPWIAKTLLNETVQTLQDIDAPQFVNTLGRLLLGEIQHEADIYAKIAIALGIVIAVTTQLAIRYSNNQEDFDGYVGNARTGSTAPYPPHNPRAENDDLDLDDLPYIEDEAYELDTPEPKYRGTESRRVRSRISEEDYEEHLVDSPDEESELAEE